jgi:hypothetical protein
VHSRNKAQAMDTSDILSICMHMWFELHCIQVRYGREMQAAGDRGGRGGGASWGRGRGGYEQRGGYGGGGGYGGDRGGYGGGYGGGGGGGYEGDGYGGGDYSGGYGGGMHGQQGLVALVPVQLPNGQVQGVGHRKGGEQYLSRRASFEM